jgi:phosphoribosylformylglycinamidine synthase subunit PurQ / glutaminase
VSPRVGIVVFPGSNCEQDCKKVMTEFGGLAEYVWHGDSGLGGADVVILPGGFAHGDYLRTGALARFSPIMDAVAEHARSGGLVIGICNGFQVLCEAGLLPGALRKNAGLKFLCKWTELRVENNRTPFSTRMEAGQILRIPINHFEGNWYCDARELESIKANGQVALRYVDNPNGSLDDVAGITNEAGNVFGLMPHPERASELLLGSEDGALIFKSMLDHVIEAGDPAAVALNS